MERRRMLISRRPRGKGSNGNGNQYRSGNAYTISQNVLRNYENDNTSNDKGNDRATIMTAMA